MSKYEFRGTPGPWRYTMRNANEIMTTFHGVQIGKVYMDVTTENEPEDAKLVSAEPDLLAVCCKVANLNPEAGEIGEGMLRQIVSAAQEAVSKATGAELERTGGGHE